MWRAAHTPRHTIGFSGWFAAGTQLGGGVVSHAAALGGPPGMRESELGWLLSCSPTALTGLGVFRTACAFVEKSL